MTDIQVIALEAGSKLNATSEKGGLIIAIEPENIPMFQELVQRGTNLWPDASPELKIFADLVTTGAVQQDYKLQSGVNNHKPGPLPELPPLPAKEMSGRFSNKLADITCNSFITVDGKVFNYGRFVASLIKDMGSTKDDLLHAAVGVSGEAGELLDAIKKHWAYNKPLDVENVKEEIGDILFYVTAAMLVLELDLHAILQQNADKLATRYAGLKYSDEAAQARADKTEEIRNTQVEQIGRDFLKSTEKAVPSQFETLQLQQWHHQQDAIEQAQRSGL